MNATGTGPALRTAEFVPLVALLMALVALSTDGMLPALSVMGRDLRVPHENDVQYVVTSLFIGLGIGQLCFGPLSDSIGRKNAIHAGLVVFMIGCLIAVFATDFEMMIAGRMLQGIGVAGPRVVTVALVRDQYEGRRMARLMSFAMAVFIFVPTVAPALGQVILWVGGWRSIFAGFLLIAAVACAWLALRQPETLPVDRRRPLAPRVIGHAVLEIVRLRTALGFTLATGLVFAPFIAYLSTAPQIFQGAYRTGDLFPVYFGALALGIGCVFLVNGRLVMKYGMRPLVKAALVSSTLSSLVGFVLVAFCDGLPPLWLFMAYLMITFACVGLLFGNLNALAMEPLGHIAGVGASVVASISTFISVPLGAVVGQMFDGTMYALVGSFAIFSAGALVAVRWAAGGRGGRAA